MEKRFKIKKYPYLQYYLVECPRCKKEAIVTRPDMNHNAELKCRNCMYMENSDQSVLYKVSVKRNCPCCGDQIYEMKDNLKKPLKELSSTCLKCGFKAEYTPNVYAYKYVPEIKGMKGDPFFKLPLRLQTNVKGNLFWAYNREHLEQIREYVDADLREIRSLYSRSMFAWLPKFIKDAKNREAVLKAISQLQKNT